MQINQTGGWVCVESFEAGHAVSRHPVLAAKINQQRSGGESAACGFLAVAVEGKSMSSPLLQVGIWLNLTGRLGEGREEECWGHLTPGRQGRRLEAGL
jgi:hypothetical protein